MPIILILLLLLTPAFADCTINSDGDKTCCDKNVCMTYDSDATAQRKIQAQAIIDAQNTKKAQKDAIQSQLDANDIKSVRSMRSSLRALLHNQTLNAQDVSMLDNDDTQAQNLRAQINATSNSITNSVK